MVACSEDALEDETVELDSSKFQYTFNDNDSGYYDPAVQIIGPWDHPGINYVSPWDVWERSTYDVTYGFRNGAENSIYTLEFTPYIGLAYFDNNANDGRYRDPAQGFAIVANFATGNYPNLYQNNKEIGNLIAAKPLTLDGTTMAESEMTVGEQGNHCPVTGNNLLPWNPNGKYFDLSNSGATSQEIQLLAKYGKVFFYRVRAINNNTGNILDFGYVQLENSTLNPNPNPSIPWQNTTVTAFSPVTNGAVPLHYYYANIPGGTQWGGPMSAPNSNTCDSREIDFPYGGNKPFNITVNDNSTGGTPVILKYEVSQGANLWRSSSPVLSLTY